MSINMRWLIFFTLISIINCQSLNVKFFWDKIDYDFVNLQTRDSYIKSGDFVPRTNLPTGVATWKDKMFITVPRWRKGVPSTLNYVPLSGNSDKSPKLIPYPSWEANNINSHSEDALISIFRVRVDDCDRLWGVDMGVEDMLKNFTIKREPRLVIIDLKTDKIIRTHAIKEHTKGFSNYVNLVIDSTKDSCDKAYAYIADINDPKIVVYSFAENKTWSFNHPYFSFEPLSTNVMVSGINFHWTDGLFGMALTPPNEKGARNLYFHAFAAQHEYAVSTEVLKNQSSTKTDYYHMFTLLGSRGSGTQSTTSVMDPVTGVVYFTQIHRHGLACWNTNNKLSPYTFRLISSDADRLCFPCDVNVNSYDRELYVLQSNIPKLMFGKLDDDKVIIYAASLDKLAYYCPKYLRSTW